MDPLIGRVVLDRYEVLERIGSGGMGSVFIAKQRAVDRKVALKVLRTDLMNNEHIRERFRREAEIIARLRHPHTVQLFDFGETPEGLSVMVMELLVGLPLNQRLRESGTLGIAETLLIGEQIAASLQEAHSLGLVHRDLKPANIFLVDVAGQVYAKVLDFGIARLMDEESTRLTSTGQVFGTPRYMSPEQAASTADVDARADIYSLGLILYECIVGQPPFVAQTSVQYLSAHSREPPPKLRANAPHAPRALEQLIDACLEKLPEDRPQSCEVLAKALATIRRSIEAGEPEPRLQIPRGTEGGSGATRPVTVFPAEVAAAQRRGGARALILGAVVVLCLAAAAVVAYRRWTLERDSQGVVTNAIDRTSTGSAVAALDKGHVGSKVMGDGRTSALVDGRTATAAATATTGTALVDRAIGPKSDDAGVMHVVGSAQDADRSTLGDGGLSTGVQDVDAGQGRRDAAAARADGGSGRRDGGGKPRDRRGSRTTGPAFGADALQGPRGIVIDLGDEAEDLRKIAARCEKSALRGLSKLSTVGCKDGCAILVDALCGGRTPAVDIDVAPGKKTVVVVCGEKIVRKQQVRFVEGKTAKIRCK